jgi:hypothetical protein
VVGRALSSHLALMARNGTGRMYLRRYTSPLLPERSPGDSGRSVESIVEFICCTVSVHHGRNPAALKLSSPGPIRTTSE